MLYTKDIRDWIRSKSIQNINNFYVGRIDKNKTNCICVYEIKDRDSANIAIGGNDTTKTKSKRFSILLRYNKNYTETEQKAQELYDLISGTINEVFNGFTFNYMQMARSSSDDLSSDDDNIYERLIEFVAYYSEN